MRLIRTTLNLRRRVAFALIAVVALFVCAQGILSYLSLEEQEDDVVDDLVLGEAQLIATRIARREMDDSDFSTLGLNFSGWFVGDDGRAVPGPLPAHLAGLSDGPHRLHLKDAELHVIVMRAEAGRLFLQYNAERNEAKVRQFGWYLLGLALLCILLTVVVAFRIAAFVVAPIERVTRLLNHWAPDPGRSDDADADEERRLLDAFARVQARFEQSIARERELLGNLQHELRTPLTAARTDLELLLPGSPEGTQNHERIRRALGSIDAVADVLASARALARGRDGERQPVALAQCVDDAWASLGELPQHNGLRLSNRVPRDRVQIVDPHALLTILRNLMRNAADHAAPGLCIVQASGNGIEVIDDGPGIPDEELPHLFERYYRGRRSDSPDEVADGSRGLGLAIARELAQANGWRISAASASPRGARFVLDLGAI